MNRLIINEEISVSVVNNKYVPIMLEYAIILKYIKKYFKSFIFVTRLKINHSNKTIYLNKNPVTNYYVLYNTMVEEYCLIKYLNMVLS